MHFIDTSKTQKGTNYLGDTLRLLDYSLIDVSDSNDVRGNNLGTFILTVNFTM